MVAFGFAAVMPALAQELSQPFSCIPGVILRLPADWKRFESEALSEAAKEAVSSAPNARLRQEQAVAGFQLGSNEPHLGAPKILVITNGMERLTDQNLREMVPYLKQIREEANNAVSGTEVSAKVPSVSYDNKHHFLRVEASLTGPGDSVHVVSIMFAAQSGPVTFLFESPEEKYQQFSMLFSNVAERIEVFRPEYRIPPSDPAARETNKVYWTPEYGRMRWTGSGWALPHK